MRTNLLTLALLISLAACSDAQDCRSDINVLPMYGRVKKCKEQIAVDEVFLKEMDNLYHDRKIASMEIANLGWEHFYKNELETAMKKFNQAWLLDSNNYQAYWGYGNIEGKRKNYKESIAFFERALSLNDTNASLLESSSTSFFHLFLNDNDEQYLDTGINYLRRSLSIDSNNIRALSQLVIAYSYNNKDSAFKYMQIVDRKDKTLIPDEIRIKIMNK